MISLVATIAMVVIVVSMIINPNDYRSQLQSIAAQSGIELQINGDMQWTFFPPGIRLNQVDIGDRQQPLTGTFTELAVGIKWLALLNSNNTDVQIPVSDVLIKDGRLVIQCPTVSQYKSVILSSVFMIFPRWIGISCNSFRTGIRWA